MENVNRWYFSKEELAATPSRRHGIDVNKELSYRQQAANFIQDMGQRLQVSQLCINTAIVYMHRFYVFHSFSEVHRNSLSVAALFLAAKIEEQPRKLEHVIKVAHVCLHKDSPPLDVRTEAYAEKQFEVVAHENVLLQMLGFVLAIEHPHTYVVKVCQLVKASKDLAQTSYFMATTSLHMTTMCLQYRPTVVACVCIHLACKWSSWKIEPCSEGKEWYYYVDKSVTLELLETLTQEFIAILETSPHRFKRKFIAQKEGGCHGPRNSAEDLKHQAENKYIPHKREMSSPLPSTSSVLFNLSTHIDDKPVPKLEISDKHSVPSQPVQSPPSKKMKVSSSSLSINDYREKKEKERLEQKPAPLPSEPALQQPVIKKPQHALSDLEKVHKSATSSSEQHSHPLKEKSSKSSVSKEHQVHSTSVNKVNHHLPKIKDISKSDLLKLTSSVSNAPVVVLERVDMKSEVQDISAPEVLCPASKPVLEKHTGAHDQKYPIHGETVNEPKESLPVAVAVTSSVTTTKSKHPKHKTNSLHNSHNCAQPLPHKQSPIKDIKTNGSKEADPNERRNMPLENNIGSSKNPESSSKHERRDKHKSKHSSNSSKDKSISNHMEQSNPNPAIKVKIRRDIISLPESNQKSQPTVKHETPKKSIKIKISKPPVESPGAIKLVLTKDKSGSGSYSTSHKYGRESKKRSHSPTSHDSVHKNFGETATKHAKLDHAHLSMKQSKARHSSSRSTDHASNDVSSGKLMHVGNDSTGYLDGETYGSQPYYSNQYFPYKKMNPPPPPPPGLRGKTNSNPPLPPPLPPQPPPPPPPE